ncbi:MAG: DUF5686 family protein [Flavobacteriaceae bacterium]
MLRPYFAFIFLLPTVAKAQLQGIVVDENSQPLQDVSVHIQNTYQGTVTNKEGYFFLETPLEKGVLMFHFLGYQPFTYSFLNSQDSLQIQMKISPVTLKEIEIRSSENPAHRIIRNAQKKRKSFLEVNRVYTANFYSRGIFRMHDVPEKFMGIAIGDFDGALDSKRSGILYLSETQSKIFQQKNDFSEIVYASKVSGNDNGFSFNSAKEADFNFYANTLDFGNAIVSPIGVNAFRYYKYQLEDSFYTLEGKLVNKIILTPKTSTAPAFKGTIYIVEDDWVIYGLNVVLEKKRMQLTGIDDLQIVQQFQFNESQQRWSKTNQVINFGFQLFNFKGNGRFSAVYSNYDFSPRFAPQTFGAALQRFEEQANKKDSLYWKENRPIQLTIEEKNDYRRKDSIRTVRSSPHYLDSIDQANNTFKWKDILGKTIQNSQKRTHFTYLSPFRNLNFNVVQGGVLGMQINWKKDYEITKKNHEIQVGTDYGFADHKWYPNVNLDFLQNRVNYSRWQFNAERKLMQFDEASTITNVINGVASLYFKDNLARFYEHKKMGMGWSGYVASRFHLSYGLDYIQRLPRTNSTQYSVRKKDTDYAVNLPERTDFDFDPHRILTQRLRIQYRHKQQYYENPNERFYSFDDLQPRISLHLEQGLGSTISRYNYLKLDLFWRQNISLGAMGISQIGLRAGGYLTQGQPSFMDMTHFHGNETFIRNKAFRSFQLLPYYQKSTRNNYAVAHWEHDFYKWGLGSLPIFKQLQTSLLIGGNVLFIQGSPPYWEGFVGLGNLGIGNIRGIRVDFVRAWGATTQPSGIRVGLNMF